MISSLFLISYGQYDAFKVARFGDIQEDWVVLGLAADFKNAGGAVGVHSGRAQHLEEVRLADVVGAGAGDQHAAGPEHFEGAEVQFLVAAESGVEIAAG